MLRYVDIEEDSVYLFDGDIHWPNAYLLERIQNFSLHKASNEKFNRST